MTGNLKKVLLQNLPYLIFVYVFDKLIQAVRLAPGIDASQKLLHLSQGFSEAFSNMASSLHLLDLGIGIPGAVLVRLAVYAKAKNAKKYRRGMEYGSARWGTAAGIAPYVDPVPDWNIPLTQTEKLTMSSRPKIPKYARDKKSGHQRQLSGDLLRLQRLCFLCSHQYRPAEQHRAAGRPGATQYLHPRIIRQCQTRRSGVFRRHL